MQIAKDTVVSLDYEMRDAHGEKALLDKTEIEPMIYLHGGYDGIFPLVEEKLHGQSVGAHLSVVLEPDDAFGEYDATLVRLEDASVFPTEVSIGMQFEGVDEETDEWILFTVTDIQDGKVVVDGNHPLAGKTLEFDCVVRAVRSATAEEIAHGHVHGVDGHDHHH